MKKPPTTAAKKKLVIAALELGAVQFLEFDVPRIQRESAAMRQRIEDAGLTGFGFEDPEHIGREARKTLPVETERHAFAYVFEGSGTFDADNPTAAIAPRDYLERVRRAQARSRLSFRLWFGLTWIVLVGGLVFALWATGNHDASDATQANRISDAVAFGSRRLAVGLALAVWVGRSERCRAQGVVGTGRAQGEDVPPARITLRLVPEIGTRSHLGLQTALLTSKFGISSSEVLAAQRQRVD